MRIEVDGPWVRIWSHRDQRNFWRFGFRIGRAKNRKEFVSRKQKMQDAMAVMREGNGKHLRMYLGLSFWTLDRSASTRCWGSGCSGSDS